MSSYQSTARRRGYEARSGLERLADPDAGVAAVARGADLADHHRLAEPRELVVGGAVQRVGGAPRAPLVGVAPVEPAGRHPVDPLAARVVRLDVVVLARDPLQVVDRPDPADVAGAGAVEDAVHVPPRPHEVVGGVAVHVDAPGVPGAVHLVHQPDVDGAAVGGDVAGPRADELVEVAVGDAGQADLRLLGDVRLALRGAPRLPGDHRDRPGAGHPVGPVGTEAPLAGEPLLEPVDDPRARAVRGRPVGDGAGGGDEVEVGDAEVGRPPSAAAPSAPGRRHSAAGRGPAASAGQPSAGRSARTGSSRVIHGTEMAAPATTRNARQTAMPASRRVQGERSIPEHVGSGRGEPEVAGAPGRATHV